MFFTNASNFIQTDEAYMHGTILWSIHSFRQYRNLIWIFKKSYRYCQVDFIYWRPTFVCRLFLISQPFLKIEAKQKVLTNPRIKSEYFKEKTFLIYNYFFHNLEFEIFKWPPFRNYLADKASQQTQSTSTANMFSRIQIRVNS